MHRQPTAIETYECFLRGRQRMHTMQQPHMDEARALYQRAIELDAEYAPAWAGLATLHALLYEWWGSNDDDLDDADRASRIAMELAPELADAHLARGYTLSNLRRYEEAQPALRSGRAHQSESVRRLLLLRSRRIRRRRHREIHRAVAQAGDVRREDFESPLLEAQSMRKLGRIEESRRREPRSGTARRAAARAQSVELACPVTRLRRAATTTASPNARSNGRGAPRALYPDDMGVIINGALLRVHLGLKEEALDLLDRVFSKGWGKKDWVENDPDYDALRDEPRFMAMMAKLSC